MQTVLGTLQRATNLYEQRVDERLVELGLRASELEVMRLASEPGGATIAEMRTATGIRASTLSSLIDRLERIGYARRSRSRRDGRSRVVEATIPGRTASDIATSILVGLEVSLGEVRSMERDLKVLAGVAKAVSNLPTAEIHSGDGLPELTV
jgi:MarR family transcriptional regulator, organic hydroperoxide resistance regulator